MDDTDTNTSALKAQLKDIGILIGWIAGIILLGGALWFFTQSIRTEVLWRGVTMVWKEDFRRLDAPIPRHGLPGKTSLLGSWYTMVNSESRVLVFSIMADGIPAPCIAVVSPAGRVDTQNIIPVNSYSKQILEHLPRGIIKTYIRRIEAEAGSISQPPVHGEGEALEAGYAEDREDQEVE
ncbi:MAG: hypothetical protein LBT14_02900 [Treponema sp.]|jgi:hypothetical protein|nr:hypothetical protein [Treponema sp.]